MSHFIKYCKLCNVVMSQCRCPSRDKEIQYGTCDKCLKSNSEQPDTKRMKATHQTFDGEVTKPKFHVTGTQVYGPATLDSDIDIVMYYSDAHTLQEELKAKGIQVFDAKHIDVTYDGFYYVIGNVKFQIICAANRDEMEAWEYATSRMKRKDPIVVRAQRVAAFKQYFNYALKG